MRPTLKDIAVRMGLDISTISRVLNQDTALRISAAKRADVLRVAQELGYTPHRSARALRLQRQFNVGFVLNEACMGEHVVADLELPVSRFRIYGLEERLSARGYLLSLLRLSGPGALEGKVLRRHLVDGLIYNCFVPSVEAERLLVRARIPTVLMDPFLSSERYTGCLNSVASDRAAGVRGAMEYLWTRGHRGIAFVSVRSNVRRLAGYRESIRNLGAAADPCLEKLFDPPPGIQAMSIPMAREAGHRATQELLEAQVPFTAVQAGSDATAAGVIDALRVAGRRVPADVAVVGYDDVEGFGWSVVSTPFLTTIRDPNYEMGARAAELLIAQIEQSAEPQQVMLQPELVLRESA